MDKTRLSFEKHIQPNLAKKEDFNTNNAWGFGGSIGTEYTLKNGNVIRTGRACYRHHPPEKFTRYFDASGKSITEQEFLENL